MSTVAHAKAGRRRRIDLSKVVWSLSVEEPETGLKALDSNHAHWGVLGVSPSAHLGAVIVAQKAALLPAHPTAHCSQGPWFPRTRPVLLRAGGLPQVTQLPWLVSGGSSRESWGSRHPAVPAGACPLAQVHLLAPRALALLNSGPPRLSVEPALPSSCYAWPQPSSEGDFDLPSVLRWPVTLGPVGHRRGARLWSQTAVVHGPSPTLAPSGHTHVQFPHLKQDCPHKGRLKIMLCVCHWEQCPSLFTRLPAVTARKTPCNLSRSFHTGVGGRLWSSWRCQFNSLLKRFHSKFLWGFFFFNLLLMKDL